MSNELVTIDQITCRKCGQEYKFEQGIMKVSQFAMGWFLCPNCKLKPISIQLLDQTICIKPKSADELYKSESNKFCDGEHCEL